MSSASAKQQVIQKIKDNTNILVTVSRDPDVDELSAALGLTLFLNALGKHATAVFSGKVPPALAFLEPDKTFEDTADSLRDFIIALDKEKADHLRYKVVDDAVKIFITPYRTTITEADLEFSQGDYNVELVLALNVESNDHLDEALTAHGKILHSADVVTVTAQEVKSTLGSVDWHDKAASGMSEMLLELVSALKTPKVTLDEQMATAFLTGIVAVTERFSNPLTSSRVMTAAAELMAAGANQQLIAVKLTEHHDEPEAAVDEASKKEDTQMAVDESSTDPEDMTRLSIDRSEKKQSKSKGAKEAADDKTTNDGALSVDHRRASGIDEVARQTQADAQDEAARAAEAHLRKHLAETPETMTTVMPGLSYEPSEIASSGESVDTASTTVPQSGTGDTVVQPEARTILSHNKPAATEVPAFSAAPLNAVIAGSDEPPRVDPFAQPPAPGATRTIAPLGEIPPAPEGIMDALAQETTSVANVSHDAALPARDTVTAALAAVPEVSDPLAAPALPTVPTAAPTLAEIEQTAQQGLPPMPDFSTLPELPPALPGTPAPDTSVSAIQAAPFNPAQFQIPGQSQ